MNIKTNPRWKDTHLKEFEDDAPVGRHHFQQHVKLRAVGGLTVGGAQGERQEVQHGWYNQRTRFMNLEEKHEKYKKCSSLFNNYSVKMQDNPSIPSPPTLTPKKEEVQTDEFSYSYYYYISHALPSPTASIFNRLY